MTNPVQNVVQGDGREGIGQGSQEIVQRTRLERPEASFDFGPTEFNGIQVWGVGGQEQHPSSCRFNGILNVIEFMNRVVIHHDNVPAFECGPEEFFHKEQHCVSINRTGDTQARAHAVQAHRSDGGNVAARISWALLQDPLAGSGPTVQSGQSEIAAHLVDEHEGLIRKTIRELPKLRAGLFVSLTGAQAFFSEAAAALVNPGRSWTHWRSCDSAP